MDSSETTYCTFTLGSWFKYLLKQMGLKVSIPQHSTGKQTVEVFTEALVHVGLRCKAACNCSNLEISVGGVVKEVHNSYSVDRETNTLIAI